MIYRYISILTSILFILVSCSPNFQPSLDQIEPGSISAVKLPPEYTHTPPPTITPTEIPTATVVPSPTSTDIPHGRYILYQSNTGQGVHLFLADIDRNSNIKITSGNKDHIMPVWSPDGKKIAFMTITGIKHEISVMDWNGQNITNLSSDGNTIDYIPVFSPDSKHIAFFSKRLGYWALFKMGNEGEEQQPLTENTGIESVVSWSPDGQMIAFTPWNNTVTRPFLAIVNADGTGYSELLKRAEYEHDPKWSPSGDLIVFVCFQEGMSQICTIKPDGTDYRVITRKPGGSDNPTWSPDGKKIALVTWRDNQDPDICSEFNCNFEIYIMNGDGTLQTNITNHPAEDWYPSWSPDGSMLAFVSLRDEPSYPECGDSCNSEIYIMNADGAEVRRLTDNNGQDWNPQWQPANE